MVAVGPSFSLGIVQPMLFAPLTVALEPLAREIGFKIVTGKQPRPTGHIESKSMNFPIEALS
jgi:hypothetical protein